MKLNRRKSALKRLENQLKLGTKPVVTQEVDLSHPNPYKNLGVIKMVDYIPLTEEDVKRIRKEIEILKRKVS